MGIFDNFSNLDLNNVFRMAPKGVVGLDIGSSSLKVVELDKRAGKAHLVKYGTLALGPYRKGNIGEIAKLPNERLAEVINTLFQAVGISSRKGGIAVPLKLSLIVTIDIPESAQSRLDTVVPLEARKYIPTSPQDVNIAWSVISKSEGRSMSAETNKEERTPMLKVLVAAIHNSTIASYQDLAAKANIKPAIFEIETFSAIRGVFGDDKGTFALVDVGSDASKVVIIDYGSISISHNIIRGSLAATKALTNSFSVSFKDAEMLKRKFGMEGAYNGTELRTVLRPDAEYILKESDQVMRSYEKTSGKNIAKVALIGAGSLLRGFSALAQDIFQKETYLGDPFARIELPAKALEPVLKENGPEYAVAAGLALRALEEL